MAKRSQEVERKLTRMQVGEHGNYSMKHLGTLGLKRGKTYH